MYGKLKKTIKEMSEEFERHFPNAMVLPAIGNNDTQFHYQPEIGPLKEDYYDFLVDEFFNNHTANRKLPNLPQIEKTMHQGGWYRVDIAPELTMLTLNTLYFNDYRYGDDADFKAGCQEQLKWLEAQLQESHIPGHKFILNSHIYETASFKHYAYPDWKEDENQKKFFELLKTYRHKIAFEVAGHDHKADFRFHTVDGNKEDFFLNKILFPSITPNASSQPAFSTFQYDTEEKTFENLEITYLRLTETNNLPKETPIT